MYHKRLLETLKEHRKPRSLRHQKGADVKVNSWYRIYPNRSPGFYFLQQIIDLASKQAQLLNEPGLYFHLPPSFISVVAGSATRRVVLVKGTSGSWSESASDGPRWTASKRISFSSSSLSLKYLIIVTYSVPEIRKFQQKFHVIVPVPKTLGGNSIWQ